MFTVKDIVLIWILFKFGKAIILNNDSRIYERNVINNGSVSEFVKQSKKAILLLNEDIKKSNQILNKIAADSEKNDLVSGVQDKEIQSIEGQLDRRTFDRSESAQLIDDEFISIPLTKPLGDDDLESVLQGEKRLFPFLKIKNMDSAKNWEDVSNKNLPLIWDQNFGPVVQYDRKRRPQKAFSKTISISTPAKLTIVNDTTTMVTKSHPHKVSFVPIHHFNGSNVCINLQQFCQSNETQVNVNKQLQDLGLNTTANVSLTTRTLVTAEMTTIPENIIPGAPPSPSTQFSPPSSDISITRNSEATNRTVCDDTQLPVTVQDRPSSSSCTTVQDCSSSLSCTTAEEECSSPSSCTTVQEDSSSPVLVCSNPTVIPDFSVNITDESVQVSSKKTTKTEFPQSSSTSITTSKATNKDVSITSFKPTSGKPSNSSEKISKKSSPFLFDTTGTEKTLTNTVSINEHNIGKMVHKVPAATDLNYTIAKLDSRNNYLCFLQEKTWEPVGVGFGLRDLFNLVTRKTSAMVSDEYSTTILSQMTSSKGSGSSDSMIINTSSNTIKSSCDASTSCPTLTSDGAEVLSDTTTFAACHCNSTSAVTTTKTDIDMEITFESEVPYAKKSQSHSDLVDNSSAYIPFMALVTQINDLDSTMEQKDTMDTVKTYITENEIVSTNSQASEQLASGKYKYKSVSESDESTEQLSISNTSDEIAFSTTELSLPSQEPFSIITEQLTTAPLASSKTTESSSESISEKDEISPSETSEMSTSERKSTSGSPLKWAFTLIPKLSSRKALSKTTTNLPSTLMLHSDNLPQKTINPTTVIPVNLAEIFATLPLYLFGNVTKKKGRFFDRLMQYTAARKKSRTTTQVPYGFESSVSDRHIFRNKITKRPLQIFILDPHMALWKNGLKSLKQRTN